MTGTTVSYRIRIRNAADSADALVVTNVRGGTNPVVAKEPSGDGQELDPVTGSMATGQYAITIADAVIAGSSPPQRVVTSQLFDSTGRQLLLSRRSYIEISTDLGSTWQGLISGYLMHYELTDAITWSFQVGDSRRIENTKIVFDGTSVNFAQRGCIFGGPIVGGGWGPINDRGGLTFQIKAILTSSGFGIGGGGSVIQYQFVNGYRGINDPLSGNIQNVLGVGKDGLDEGFVNQATDSFYSPSVAPYGWPGYGTQDVDGNPLTGLTAFVREMVSGPTRGFFTPGGIVNNLPGVVQGLKASAFAGGSFSLLWPPGMTLPTVGDVHHISMFTTTSSDQSPVYLDLHPVDIVTMLWTEAGVAYDAASAAATRTLLGDTLRVAMRITQSTTLLDFIENSIFGPFGISARVGLVTGVLELFSTRLKGTATPSVTLGTNDLQDASGVIFENDEQTIVSSVRFKTETYWAYAANTSVSTTATQPLDSVMVAPNEVAYANADANALVVNEIVYTFQGMIHDVNGIVTDMGAYVTSVALEMFDRYGRGAPTTDAIAVLRGSDTGFQVGDEVYLEPAHFPNLNYRFGDNPSVGARIMQILRRTETPAGPLVKLIDAGSAQQPVTPAAVITIAAGITGARSTAVFTVTNAAAINATGVLITAVQWATGTSSPANGVQFARYAPGTTPTSSTQLPAVSPGSTVWVRARTEEAGLRPSAWTAWTSVTLTGVPAPTIGTGPVIVSVRTVPFPIVAGAAGDLIDVFVSMNPVGAGALVVGQEYIITTLGTTNFVAVGAASNTVGIIFTATGAGSGTGTTQLVPTDWSPFLVTTVSAVNPAGGGQNLISVDVPAPGGPTTWYAFAFIERDPTSGLHSVPFVLAATAGTFSVTGSPPGLAAINSSAIASNSSANITGNTLALYRSDTSDIVIQRAPDAGGTPGTWADLTTVRGSTETFTDYLAFAQGFWYRASHDAPSNNRNYSTPIFASAQTVPAIIQPNLYGIPALDQTGSVNAIQAGGLGDGVTDQTAFLQAIIDMISASGVEGEVFIPAGVWLVNGLVMKNNCRVRGAGRNATILKAAPVGSPAAAAILLDTGIVQKSGMTDLTVQGNGNTGQHGLWLLGIPTFTGGVWQGGLWYSAFAHMLVQGFDGEQFWLHASGDEVTHPLTAPHQFLTFKSVVTFTTSTTRRALRCTGQVGQVDFDGGCEFDGVGSGSSRVLGTENVLVERSVDPVTFLNNADTAPYTLNFNGVTIQSNTRAVTVERGANIVFRGAHFEECPEGVLFSVSAPGNTVRDCLFDNMGHDFAQTPGSGTLTIAGGAGAGTFSTSQAGVLFVNASVVISGVMYFVLTFNGTTGMVLVDASGSPAPNVAGASFGVPVHNTPGWWVKTTGGEASTAVIDGNEGANNPGVVDFHFVREFTSQMKVGRNIAVNDVLRTLTLTPAAINAAATLTTLGADHLFVNHQAGVTIANIISELVPGDRLTLRANGGNLTFGTGGNIGAGPWTVPLTVPDQACIVLVRNDLISTPWIVESIDGPRNIGPVPNSPTPTGAVAVHPGSGTIRVDATTGNQTVTMDAIATFAKGERIVIAKYDSSANKVFVNGNVAGENPWGLGTNAVFLHLVGETLELENNGNGTWDIIARSPSALGTGGTLTNALTAGTHLTGGTFDGSAPVTFATDATSANTASTIVSRDGSGNFSASTVSLSALNVSGILAQSNGASAITIGYNGGGPAPAIYGDSTGRIAYAADQHLFFNKVAGAFGSVQMADLTATTGFFSGLVTATTANGVTTILRLAQTGAATWNITNNATDGKFAINDGSSTWLIIAPTTGVTQLLGATDVGGNLSVNTSKFTVAASTGNTVVAGTLGISGNFSVSSAFAVLAATGVTTISAAANATALAITDASGNTGISFTPHTSSFSAFVDNLRVGSPTTFRSSVASGADTSWLTISGAGAANFGVNVSAPTMLIGTNPGGVTALALVSDTSTPLAFVTTASAAGFNATNATSTANAAVAIGYNQSVATAGTSEGLIIRLTASHTSGTTAQLEGVACNVFVTGSGGTVTTVAAMQAGGSVSAGAAVGTFICFRAAGPGNSGTISTLVGIDIAAMTVGTANFAIRTSLGLVSLGDELLTAASTATRAGLNIKAGTAPTTPQDGDIWYDGTNLKSRTNGATHILS